MARHQPFPLAGGGSGSGRKRRREGSAEAEDADGRRGSSGLVPWGPTSSWSCNKCRVFKHVHQWMVDDFVARLQVAKTGEKVKSKVSAEKLQQNSN